MSSTTRTLRRTLVVGAASVAVAATTAPSPALAGTSFFSRSSGTFVSTSWLEMGELPAATGVPGNAHFGDLWVEDLGKGRTAAFGVVYDVQCDEGVTPYVPGHGGGHVEPQPEPEPEPEPEPCTLVSLRFIEGGNLSLSIDRKFSSARLTGTLAVGDGHGSPTAAPAVDVTWTGIGTVSTSTTRGSYTDESGSGRYSYTSSGRQATIGAGSKIGPMVFDDEPGERSSGYMGSYRSSDRYRS